jgi:hypothetical protein
VGLGGPGVLVRPGQVGALGGKGAWVVQWNAPRWSKRVMEAGSSGTSGRVVEAVVMWEGPERPPARSRREREGGGGGRADIAGCWEQNASTPARLWEGDER